MGSLILVRHGQASAFTDDYDRLSDLGRKQAELLGEWWKERGVEAALVFSGPLKRQEVTAEIVGESFRKGRLPFPEPVILEGLKEVDADRIMAHFNGVRKEYPDLDRLITDYSASGRPEEKAVIFQEYFEQAMLLWVGGRADAPGIESLSALKDRVIKSLEKILDKPGEKGDILVFSSASPVAIMTGNLLKLDDLQIMEMTFRMKNCSVTEFALKARGPVLNNFNCTGHLPSDMVTLR